MTLAIEKPETEARLLHFATSPIMAACHISVASWQKLVEH